MLQLGLLLPISKYELSLSNIIAIFRRLTRTKLSFLIVSYQSPVQMVNLILLPIIICCIPVIFRGLQFLQSCTVFVGVMPEKWLLNVCSLH